MVCETGVQSQVKSYQKLKKWYLIIFTNPSTRAGYDTRSIFKRSLTGLNSEFSFSWSSWLTMALEPSLPNYLSIAGGRRIGFIPFPRVLVRCEMQSVSSRIWTRITVSISYDDNHYTTGTSIKKWYLMPPCLTLRIIRFVSRVKWSNPENGVVLSPTPWCCSYWKENLQFANFTHHFSTHQNLFLDVRIYDTQECCEQYWISPGGSTPQTSSCTVTKTIQVRQTRHAGHCWRSKYKLIIDVLLWTPAYGRAKAGRPARTYIQQLCEDTGCSPENLPEAMNDREKWRERVRDICASSTTWWWWFYEVDNDIKFLRFQLSRPDLIQGHFIVKIREREVTHEPKCVPCWTMLVIGSLGATWTMLPFAKSLRNLCQVILCQV